MIKKIKGKTFNTDTAEKIAGLAVGEFGEETGYEETLYKTSKGVYFMYTNGGSASKYPDESIELIDDVSVNAFINTNSKLKH